VRPRRPIGECRAPAGTAGRPYGPCHSTSPPGMLEAAATPPVVRRVPMRDFGAHRHRDALTAVPFERHPCLFVLSTDHDSRADWLRAGQALEHVLLVATAHGVQASLLHQALEWPDLRDQLIPPANGRPRHPQMVIRAGYGPDGPPSPRLPVPTPWHTS
ncbi:hypothetical protein ABT404_18120, partial [Streptomyces hyaluromycini]